MVSTRSRPHPSARLPTGPRARLWAANRGACTASTAGDVQQSTAPSEKESHRWACGYSRFWREEGAVAQFLLKWGPWRATKRSFICVCCVLRDYGDIWYSLYQWLQERAGTFLWTVERHESMEMNVKRVYKSVDYRSVLPHACKRQKYTDSQTWPCARYCSTHGHL